MKKLYPNKIIFLLALFLLPVFMLTACNEVNYYSIELRKSSSRGEVHGPNKTSQIAEGTEVTLTATENEGKFVCWVKNSAQVVSIDSTYKFSMNAETAGMYIGVFSESSPEKMMYAALTAIKVEIEGVNALTANINLTPAKALTESVSLYNGETTNEQISVYNNKVFSFLNEETYLLDVSVEYEIMGFEDKITDAFPTLQINRSQFTDTTISITGQKGSSKVTLVFEKLNQTLVAQGFQA